MENVEAAQVGQGGDVSRVMKGVMTVGGRVLEAIEREHGSSESESQARAVRMWERRLVWIGRYFVLPLLLSVEGMSFVIQLDAWGVRMEVMELFSDVGRIYEVYCTVEGVACPEFAFAGPNLV